MAPKAKSSQGASSSGGSDESKKFSDVLGRLHVSTSQASGASASSMRGAKTNSDHAASNHTENDSHTTTTLGKIHPKSNAPQVHNSPGNPGKAPLGSSNEGKAPASSSDNPQVGSSKTKSGPPSIGKDALGKIKIRKRPREDNGDGAPGSSTGNTKRQKDAMAAREKRVKENQMWSARNKGMELYDKKANDPDVRLAKRRVDQLHQQTHPHTTSSKGELSKHSATMNTTAYGIGEKDGQPFKAVAVSGSGYMPHKMQQMLGQDEHVVPGKPGSDQHAEDRLSDFFKTQSATLKTAAADKTVCSNCQYVLDNQGTVIANGNHPNGGRRRFLD